MSGRGRVAPSRPAEETLVELRRLSITPGFVQSQDSPPSLGEESLSSLRTSAPTSRQDVVKDDSLGHGPVKAIAPGIWTAQN